jgi:hypothetical protein
VVRRKNGRRRPATTVSAPPEQEKLESMSVCRGADHCVGVPPARSCVFHWNSRRVEKCLKLHPRFPSGRGPAQITAAILALTLTPRTLTRSPWALTSLERSSAEIVPLWKSPTSARDDLAGARRYSTETTIARRSNDVGLQIESPLATSRTPRHHRGSAR